ncbi:DUF2267 domain-containing protein [Streptomyces roseirectus]|uniref:DUF2267 domain-containing protein n=1 Tax=Streptomyces roseirectus TaxID=2768066 RepID=A0A7H0I720_9ACTN|nr:DUF2267 domain-containing protein [Streptomyces roseirectus]QNP68586.1 DUF2267 domain-containing protein [Streptomyces roseirectus]
MTVTTVPPTPARENDWSDLVERVRRNGHYATPAEAERITRTVLAALGTQVVADERVALARALPGEAARIIAAQIPARRPLTGPEFVASVATRSENAAALATVRWDVSSVLSTLPEVAGDDLVDRVLAQLPPGYALLFGRAELIPAR